ncbi:hypothetical protein AHiyo8_62030 [Arthrobacter sp. Hiyo8]|nr:hypothetical protein AHiyo8_62030 [Arthrobacter sp. Hiyo8]
MTSNWAIAALRSATKIPVKFRRKISASSNTSAPMDMAAPDRPADTDQMSATPTTAGLGYPQNPDQAAPNLPRPLLRSCPEWSSPIRSPWTTRPVMRAANAWPSSCTKVT